MLIYPIGIATYVVIIADEVNLDLCNSQLRATQVVFPNKIQHTNNVLSRFNI